MIKSREEEEEEKRSHCEHCMEKEICPWDSDSSKKISWIYEMPYLFGRTRNGRGNKMLVIGNSNSLWLHYGLEGKVCQRWSGVLEWMGFRHSWSRGVEAKWEGMYASGLFGSNCYRYLPLGLVMV